MPATAEDIHAAALDAVAEVLASDAGPDGKPSREAKQKAKQILLLLRDPAAMEELAGEEDD